MSSDKICCFTGHRSLTYSEMRNILPDMQKTLRNLIGSGVKIFRAGGAVGFDTLAALCVLGLKKKFPGIRLELILPCKNQTKGWSGTDIDYYNHIIKNCDSYTYVSEAYTRDCMLERNRRLVDGSNICVAYCRNERGGTAYTVNYARRKGVAVINLYK